ncbi:S8 family peptidase [Streptomyces alkaliterrae]|uniref:S8 family peptidase n=1 Tax=Streptomyces alkaliterrae TaxID=2213162 RepID=A0A5P0YN31_9ACTN|nr:S8 family peptidase [Streptomyces alkaliterrae]MBB1253897.1 S8 family peptidase [Streptomyces alkaliterrae]MBB1260467.1 S8 family peptidase [Streptomyces alkaliterrae]MQS01671.1 S8 family serine peptidase [Streptomyces alkaliterrae]
MRRSGPIRLVLGAGAVALAVLGTTLGTAGAVSSESRPLGEIRGADVGPVIRGEYIVVLKKKRPEAGSGISTAEDVRSRARGLAGRYDGSLRRTYSAALQGFSVRMTEAKARRLAADPAVAYVEPDRVEYGDDVQTDPVWGLDRVDQRDLPLDKRYEYTRTAGNVTAYVVDSGVRIGHQDFEGRASYGYNFVDDNTTASDCHGHGTHVAGTIGGRAHGVAKKVRIVAVKVLNCQNSGTTANVLAGYDWVVRNAKRPAVANVSIGGSPAAAKDAGVRAMVQAGITVAVSAGNKDTDACTQSPAREPSVITVAATARDDRRSTFSNHGSCVDVFAPGTSIVSTGHGSNTATATMSGTSMATPHVTAVAALHLAGDPGATPAKVTDALLGAASRGKVTGPGAGSPNRLVYSGF